MTCNGCVYDLDGRCRALPPAPRVDGGHADRASWPQHDGKGCGGYVAAKSMDVAESAAPKRVKLKGP